MRNAFIIATILIAALFVVGCRQPVDEELLPTRVPQVDMQTLVQAAEDARPTPRPTPTVTPLPTPTAEGSAGGPDSVVITYGDSVIEGADEAAADAPVEEAPVDEATTDDASNDAAEDSTDAGSAAAATAEPTAEANSEAVDAAATESPTADPIIAQSVEDFEAAPGVEVEVAETETMTEAVVATDSAADTVTETKTVTETDTVIVTVTEVNTVTETIPSEGVSDSTTVTDTTSVGEETSAADMTLPESIQTAIQNADLMRGEQLILTTGCTGCHAMDHDTIFVGPSWYDLATTSGNRVEGMDAKVYMYRSIMYPNEYLVPGFENSAMLPNYQETLSDQDVGDLIGYMLTLRAR